MFGEFQILAHVEFFTPTRIGGQVDWCVYTEDIKFTEYHVVWMTNVSSSLLNAMTQNYVFYISLRFTSKKYADIPWL